MFPLRFLYMQIENVDDSRWMVITFYIKERLNAAVRFNHVTFPFSKSSLHSHL